MKSDSFERVFLKLQTQQNLEWVNAVKNCTFKIARTISVKCYHTNLKS